ncbi:alanine/ornithine racemase family PLP-dependent enzyme [Anaerosphaera multitolerans]|uniref:Alanine/ornithine racemase family PLP-dependent enzyme n=1 Tax=Anaerosphaera multitolerans TaxID=2487351 RepID=A0A437S8X1_9FIRM|nr:alanine/ornithine racemase family PLP-dependent enzyme [Anaerosphaera multitolerans]RVU55550.1 alanine/ornithine racemase family PLP-dependent enzyme [Anaerosphaera multitolerans]
MTAKLKVYLNKIKHNIETVEKLCGEREVEITAVTKMFGSDETILKAFLESGISKIGDAEISNFKSLQHLDVEKWAIRIPGFSEVEDMVKYCDVSLNSELDIIKEIEKASKVQGKVHKIILMKELGDLREGILSRDEFLRIADYVLDSKYVELYGLGTNLTCFSFVQPSVDKMLELVELSKEIFGNKEVLISGGNSSTIDLMRCGDLPLEVNNLRLGESLLFGREGSFERYVKGTYDDTFLLEVEILEIKDKPSKPWGEVGLDSYGHKHSFKDSGVRRRAVCGVGKKSIDVEATYALDENIEIVGASSDHLVLDISDSEKNYKVGDVVDLKLEYFSALMAMQSDYVKKEYIY